MLVKAKDLVVRKLGIKVEWNGIDVTNDCFEFFIDEKNPKYGWVKVYVRKDGRFQIDPVTRTSQWKLLHGEIVTQPPFEELQKIQEGVAQNG